MRRCSGWPRGPVRTLEQAASTGLLPLGHRATVEDIRQPQAAPHVDLAPSGLVPSGVLGDRSFEVFAVMVEKDLIAFLVIFCEDLIVVLLSF
jgi:hypothetical protein